MDMTKDYRKLLEMQIDILERYVNLLKVMESFEMKLNGNISQTDLMMNNIVNRLITLNDEGKIHDEQELVYKNCLTKKYAQIVLRNNQKFVNVFRQKHGVEETEEQIKEFITNSRKIMNVEDYMNFVIKGRMNGTTGYV